MTITRVIFNWYATPENGEEFTQIEVNNYNDDLSKDVVCIQIDEKLPAGEGDRLWYDCHFSDGTMTRIFNPNMVFYETEQPA